MKLQNTKHCPAPDDWLRGMRMLQISKLRRAFGLTLQQAVLIAALLYGEGAE